MERTSKIKKASDQQIGTIDFGRDVSGQFARDFLIVIDAFLQDFRGGANGAQWIAKLVRESSGKLAEGGEAFGAADGGLCVAQIMIGDLELVRCFPVLARLRSEERRVGKECRLRGSPYH